MRRDAVVLPDTWAMQKQFHDLLQAMSQTLQFGSFYYVHALGALGAGQAMLFTRLPRCMAHD